MLEPGPTPIDLEQVQGIVEAVRPYLAGKRPELQGAALAQLLSMWIAGHYQLGPEAIDGMLVWHVEMVRKLVPLDIEIIQAKKKSL